MSGPSIAQLRVLAWMVEYPGVKLLEYVSSGKSWRAGWSASWASPSARAHMVRASEALRDFLGTPDLDLATGPRWAGVEGGSPRVTLGTLRALARRRWVRRTHSLSWCPPAIQAYRIGLTSAGRQIVFTHRHRLDWHPVDPVEDFKRRRGMGGTAIQTEGR